MGIGFNSIKNLKIKQLRDIYKTLGIDYKKAYKKMLENLIINKLNKKTKNEERTI